MSIFDDTLTVGAGGLVTVQVSAPAGSRVRVTVALDAGQPADGSGGAAQSSGPLYRVLADPAEDVWNDL